MDDELLAPLRPEQGADSPAPPQRPQPSSQRSPLDASVAGRAPWDRPSAAWDDLPLVDDGRAGSRALHDATPMAVPPVSATRPTDPYDADAPVLGDVRPGPAAAAWPSWPQRPPQTGSPVTPPSLAGRGLGPTPPDDLFARARHAPSAQPASSPPPAAAPTTTPGLWSQPAPMPSWQSERPSRDPLASLPAATFARTELPALFAPPEPRVAAPDVAADDLSLWSVTSRPLDLDQLERMEPETHEPGEPSSLVTLALTLLMAVVVMGLVLAFVSQMTSLPILR